MRHSLLALLTMLAALPLAACASAADEAESAPCDLTPELGVAPRKIALNGSSFDGSETVLNGRLLNGIQANGIQVNGVQNNGIQNNGTQPNGIGTAAMAFKGLALAASKLQGVDLGAAAMNELVGVTNDGRVLSGEDYVGSKLPAILADGTTIELVIVAFERTRERAELAHYQIEYEGKNVCADGKKGIFVPGVWDARGARHEATTVAGHVLSATFSCASGVIAKCALWGYAPWSAGADVYQTCTRMARADYCGTGVSYTKEGTPIDVFDARDIQQPTNEAGLVFEAGWAAEGATCVNRPRYDARAVGGDALLPACWQALPTCSSFEDAKALGAIIGNTSRPQSRRICGQ